MKNSKHSTSESRHTDSIEPPTVARFRAEYEAADELSRIVANFRKQVAIPAHNELRYAGHHYLKARSDDGTDTDLDQLQRAIAHCQRAAYEAADAGIMSALDMIHIFMNDYRRIVVADIVPNYGEIKRTSREAQRLLSQAREHTGDVPIVNEEYRQMFLILKEHVEALEDHRDELNKRIQNERDRYLRWIFAISISVAMGIIAIALA